MENWSFERVYRPNHCKEAKTTVPSDSIREKLIIIVIIIITIIIVVIIVILMSSSSLSLALLL